MAGDTVIAVLAQGTKVRVAKVSGRWIAVDAVVKGARTIGWVNVAELQVKPINVGDKLTTIRCVKLQPIPESWTTEPGAGSTWGVFRDSGMGGGVIEHGTELTAMVVSGERIGVKVTGIEPFLDDKTVGRTTEGKVTHKPFPKRSSGQGINRLAPSAGPPTHQ